MAVSISRLAFEHHRVPLGIHETAPRISWRFDGTAKDWEQSSYELEVIRGGAEQANAFAVNASDSLYVPWPDEPLASRESAQVRARAHGKEGQSSTPWSDWVSVETGLLADEWSAAVPISADRTYNVSLPKEPIYLRKSFSLGSPIASARLYITALGVYEVEINGKKVGDYILAPGFQTYTNRHAYDTYDVTEHVKQGGNGIGIHVGEGWYAGRLWSFLGVRNRNFYGDTIGALSLLVVTLEDGTTVEVPTDQSWQASLGPTKAAELFDGAKYDSRLEADFEGWSTSDFDSEEKGWIRVKELPPLRGKLVAPDAPPSRRLEEIKPDRVFKSPNGTTLIDFGQNLVGWLRVTVSGPEGQVIGLRHAEVLDTTTGGLGIRPLRTAQAYDTLTLHGKGEQTWEPKFTFHGFRFASVEGWPADSPISIEDGITAIVVHTDMEQTGWFNSSNPLLNRFHENVRWSMKGNFLSIPTDCPQRDERAGWTGDVHAFGPTSNYLYDTAGFYRGWHRDVWAEMTARSPPDNIVPPIVPMLPPGGAPTTGFGRGSTAIWGDVAVANPYNLWQAFGDKAMLKEQFEQAQVWVDKGILRGDNGLWDPSTFQFGDWLDPLAPPNSPGQATTHTHLVADEYLIGMTEKLAKMAAGTGDMCLGQKYQRRRAEHVRAFWDRWMNEDGEMANRTQTAYALGIWFNIFAEEDVARAKETLRELVVQNDYAVGTGFAGTHLLGFAMAEAGAVDEFYQMLMRTEVPSWLYQVVMNGTTTWERWDSLLPNGDINPGSMTSFNHYAFGSVANWIHQYVGGLAPAEPGWKRIAVHPRPGGNLEHAETTFLSPYGKTKSSWRYEGAEFVLSVTVPPNTRAVVTLPSGKETEVGSGEHEFRE